LKLAGSASEALVEHASICENSCGHAERLFTLLLSKFVGDFLDCTGVLVRNLGE
jgi:hypothetical protein